MDAIQRFTEADCLIDLVEHLEDVSNLGALCRLLVPSP